MYGRFAIIKLWFGHPEKALSAEPGPGTPCHNIASAHQIPVIRRTEDGGHALNAMRWGVVRSWAKEPGAHYANFNARIETVAQKAVCRAAFKRRKCLIPASGFYEWHTEPDGTKQHCRFILNDGREMALAGLWEQWEGKSAAFCNRALSSSVLPIP